MPDNKGKGYTEGDVNALLVQAVAEGKQEGKAEGMAVVLGWLEDAYINDPGRPDRESPKGKAILELARDCGKFIRKELGIK